jgi:hypothetical protein
MSAYLMRWSFLTDLRQRSDLQEKKATVIKMKWRCMRKFWTFLLYKTINKQNELGISLDAR